MRPSLVLGVVLLASGAAACSSSNGYPTSSGGGGGGHTTTIVLASSTFSPSPDTVAVGATVTWSNHDGYTHTVFSSPGSPETYNGQVPASSTFTHTFNTAGTYPYYCSIHGTPTSGMRGTIVVR